MTAEFDYPAPLRPEFFERQDEDDDARFYAEPRLVTHIDDEAIAALSRFYATLIRPRSAVLDLMCSWISHLPAGLEFERVAGLGLNEAELAENPMLDERIVQDLNRNPVLPFDDASFDAAVVPVSVQYLVRPVEVFAEVGRTLKPGAPFAVAYSNRMFPTKAVAIWRSLGHRERAELAGLYFRLSGRFGPPRAVDISPGPDSDPLVVVVAEVRPA